MNYELRIPKEKSGGGNPLLAHASCFWLRDSSAMGFTLIEMMVSVSIFAIVMLVSTGALLSVVSNDRKAQAQQSSFSNIDFALESISRAMRVGATYRCITGNYSSASIDVSQDCNSGGSALAFEPFGGSSATPDDQVVFRLNGTQIERSTQGGASSTFIPVTSPDVVVEGLRFYVRGSTLGDIYQPTVLISIYGHAGTAGNQVNFNVQTTVTERLLDI